MIGEITCIYAQQDVVVAGGQASGSGGKASYSIGQINYLYTKNNDVTVNAGVQQPLEFFIIKEENGNETGFEISATAYPNPASEYLNLRIDAGKIEDLSYKIYDEQGRLVKQQNIVNKETTISLKELINSLYFLKVYKSIFVMQSFKIIKSK